MSIKIIDSCCAINILERMRSFDCTLFLSGYESTMTKEVLNELRRGESFKGFPFVIYSLSKEEQEMYNDAIAHTSKLGEGERSVIIHALFLSNQHNCDGSDKIIVLCDDKEAAHIFYRRICRDPETKRKFPNAEKIIWSDTVGIIEKIWRDGLLDDETEGRIYVELYKIIGPKRLCFLRH